MSENLDATRTTTTTTVVVAPQGKGMAVAGFIIALVALVLNNVMAGIAILAIIAGGSGWLMYLWLVVNIFGMILSIMAMSKLKKSGGKRGLAIAGMIIGIVGTVWAIMLVMGLSIAAAASGNFNDEAFKDAFKEGMQKELNDM